MKNIGFYSVILGLLIAAAIFLFSLFDSDKESVIPKEGISIESSKDIALKEKSLEIDKEEILAENTPSSEIANVEKYIKEFNIPEDIHEEFLDALKAGKETVKYSGNVTDEELNEAGLSLARISESAIGDDMENITSGYSVSDKDFNEMVSACFPSGVNEDAGSALLKSQALATIGLSAVAEHRYDQAETAFTNLINNYPDQEPTQMARLEYANLLSEQGRSGEARQAIDEAITINSSDNGYISIANTLKQRIERYE